MNVKQSCGRRVMLKMALPIGQCDVETRHRWEVLTHPWMWRLLASSTQIAKVM